MYALLLFLAWTVKHITLRQSVLLPWCFVAACTVQPAFCRVVLLPDKQQNSWQRYQEAFFAGLGKVAPLVCIGCCGVC